MARSLSGLVPLAWAAHALTQPPPAEPWTDWGRLARLESGRQIRVETFQPKRKLRGRFVTADDHGITIEYAGGTSETLGRTQVRKVVAEREAMKYAPLVGAAAGFFTFLAVVAAEEDLVVSGKLAFAGMGAGIGALGGWGVGALGKSVLVYEAPKPSRAPPGP